MKNLRLLIELRNVRPIITINILKRNKENNATKTRLQETLEFELVKSIDNFSLNTPLEMEEEKYTIAVTSLEVYSSVFHETEHNNIFPNYTRGYWQESDTIKRVEMLAYGNSNQFNLRDNEINKKTRKKVGRSTNQFWIIEKYSN